MQKKWSKFILVIECTPLTNPHTHAHAHVRIACCVLSQCAHVVPQASMAEWMNEEASEKERMLHDRWSVLERELPAGTLYGERLLSLKCKESKRTIHIHVQNAVCAGVWFCAHGDVYIDMNAAYCF